MPIQQLQPHQLRDWLRDQSRPAPILLDVREPWEVQICKIEGSVAIPMNSISNLHSTLKTDVDTVVVCHHGGRSMQVALFLERNGFTKLHNLSGGVDAWARQIDPAMTVY
jgi:rhodanese-related sulfurtransferase